MGIKSLVHSKVLGKGRIDCEKGPRVVVEGLPSGDRGVIRQEKKV